MPELLNDVRYAVRSLSKRPGFTLVAVLSITLAIGFNTAIFSAVNALLLRPVPGVVGADRVVELGRTNRGSGFDSFSYVDFTDLRENVAELSELAAWRMLPVSHGGDEGGERLVAMVVSPGYFPALGITPAAGRFFGEDDDVPGASPATVVISHAFWQTRLGGAPDVVGRTVDVNRAPFTVIGVTPPSFRGHFPLVGVDMWLPVARIDLAEPSFAMANFDRRGSIWHNVIGRLAPGVPMDRAELAVRAEMARLAEAYPETNETRGATLLELGPVPGGGRGMIRGFLGALLALVALVLLVAAANVGGMLLARGAAREREVAIRLALGSGRVRLVRQLTAEAVLLFLLGAAAGLALAWWASSLISVISAPGLAITLDLAPDRTVFLFTLGIALATGLLFGLVPALQTSRPELVSSLKDEGRTGRRGVRTRRLFVAVQVGVSIILMTAGGLLVRSLHEARQVSPGFDPDGVHLVTLDLSLDAYTDQTGPPFQAELRTALADRPGVSHAALAVDLPMDLSEWGNAVWPDGWDDPEGRGMSVDANFVSADYFETLRIPVIRGRGFNDADRRGSTLVVVVSETLAREAWPDRDPIGRRIRWSDRESEPRTVIGVVADTKNQTLGEPLDGMVYLPLLQEYQGAVSVLARGPGVTPAILRSALLELDPRLAISTPQTLAEITAVGLLPARVAAYVAGLLGALGLFLSALGIYGVVAHGVVQRRREIGIRMAIGAHAGRVLRGVVGDGLRLALPGLLLGTLAALVVARLIRGMLFGVSPMDPLTLATVALLLMATVGLASWIPARRAASVDPVEALRAE
jgi:predicted permease